MNALPILLNLRLLLEGHYDINHILVGMFRSAEGGRSRCGEVSIWDRIKFDAAFSDLDERRENMIDRALPAVIAA